MLPPGAGIEKNPVHQRNNYIVKKRKKGYLLRHAQVKEEDE